MKIKKKKRRKKKTIDFETIRIITKEYSYDKPKITLTPEISKIETKYYKLNHFNESKSNSRTMRDPRDSNWNISVINTTTKSYDRWDEIDDQENIINKGEEINVVENNNITNIDRYEVFRGCHLF